MDKNGRITRYNDIRHKRVDKQLQNERLRNNIANFDGVPELAENSKKN